MTNHNARPHAVRAVATLLALLLGRATGAGAAEVPMAGDLGPLLTRKILDAGVPTAEVQAYCEARVPPMPEVGSAADWGARAAKIRADVLERVVFRGQAKAWRDAKVGVEWLGTIDGGPGYRIRKLRYEAVPGLWVPALLYEPAAPAGRVPAVLNVNGHDPAGKAAAYKQVRCINLAKRGVLALNVEWIGMGQLAGPANSHEKMNHLDLCGTSGVAVHYLAMTRAIDLLLAHPNADAGRLAVTGLSGGGWQTIFVSSLDTRVTLANPVAGYSSFKTRARHLSDLGDSEQTPSDLATAADYAHLTALMAPRPTLLTFNAKDDCCFASGHALGPLVEAAGPVFGAFGKRDFLRTHVNAEPGTHQYGVENRQAFYRMVGDHFFAGRPGYDAAEIPSDAEVKTEEQLAVELPADNASFQSLASALAKDLPREAALPTERAAAVRWQDDRRAKLRDVVRFKDYAVEAARAGEETRGEVRAVYWRLRMEDDWTVPAVELTRGVPTSATTVIVADAGRAAVGQQAAQLLAAGHRVLAVDPFYFGEAGVIERDVLFALLVAAVGDRPLGIQAGQVAAVARWSREAHGAPVSVLAVGPRSSTFALLAAACDPDTIAGIEVDNPLGSLKEVIEQGIMMPEMFCFGLLERYDVLQVAALVAPRPLRVLAPSARAKAELGPLAAWAELLGGVPAPDGAAVKP